MRNKLMTLCMAMCCLCFEVIAQNLPNYVSSDGLMGWYAMDGNALDFSSNQSNGSLDGAVAGGNRLGQTDAALMFGMGASESISRMILPGLVTDVSNSFSVSFWGKPAESVIFPIQGQTGNEIPPNGQVAIHAIHGTHFGPDSAHAGFGLALATNGLSLIEHSDNWHTAPIVLQEDLSDWHHYVVVYADGVSSVYIDGTWAATGGESDRSIHISFGTDPWYPSGGIGHGYENRRYFGQLDDMGFWSRSLSEMEINSLFLEQLLIPGCTDESACNHTSDASFQDDSCIYPPEGIADCETGGVFCGDGTIWDANIQACVVSEFCQEDLDGDGVIGINDLMQLLSSFGTMCPIWMCGNPVNYHGYDYATVQIGEQCWFAENLGTASYRNGDSIQGGFDNEQWAALTDPGQSVLDNLEANALIYGRFYNWFAANDERQLCPSDWHIPTHTEWNVLTDNLGGVEVTGGLLKSSTNDELQWNGTNAVGFSALPNGYRNNDDGEFLDFGVTTIFWASTEAGASSWYRMLQSYTDWILSYSNGYFSNGYSIRCLKDTEE
ncbi:MAG: hypothetical protein CL834_03690 [Crocinitomicaceae bacterium]|nr:hypothetical protein [Crocinitomicaceae bacterium]